MTNTLFFSIEILVHLGQFVDKITDKYIKHVCNT